ncbi:unnamed protein product [Clavelina lepadiformis]
MRKELDATMSSIEKSWIERSGVNSDSNEPSTSNTSKKKKEEYDNIYFDSDDEEGTTRKSQKKRLTNDQLFYDPMADERNQQWVNRQRLRGSAKRKPNETKDNISKKSSKSTSDAILTCPACMTTLCVDCQRHEVYQGQYRAMFVLNCNVQTDEVLRYKEPKKKKFKRHRKREQSAMDVGYTQSSTSEVDSSEQVYHPVKCRTCSTEVAVYDNDEVYHFFNVIAGHA